MTFMKFVSAFVLVALSRYVATTSAFLSGASVSSTKAMATTNEKTVAVPLGTSTKVLTSISLKSRSRNPLVLFGTPPVKDEQKKQMERSGAGEKEEEWIRKGLLLPGIDRKLFFSLFIGEQIVGVAGLFAAQFFGVDLFAHSQFTVEALQQGALWSLGPFLASVLLEKSGILFFKKIDQDTRLYALQIFGSQRSIPRIFGPASLLSLSAGLCEEAFFRGFLLQRLIPVIGPLPALAVSSIAFGLAHDPVPGANSFIESLYGLCFGTLYLMSGHNLWAAIACHSIYDLLTFLEVHLRATDGLQAALDQFKPLSTPETVWPGGERVGKRVEEIRRKYNLAPQFIQMAAAVFKQLDLDGNGGVDTKELQLGLRTFGKFSSDEEVAKIMAQADEDGNGEITLDEYMMVLIKGALAIKGGGP